MSNGAPPRRRSIFGGLLFILVGGMLLANNFYADLRLGQLFRTYWPVLLILWGLAKMFDYFAARRTGAAGPPAFTGGEFFLLLLLICLGGAFTFADWLGPQVDWEGPWSRSFSFTEEATKKEIKPASQIMVTTDYGDITVVPEDTPEIRVVAQKTVRSSRRESDAQNRANQVKIEIREISAGYEIRPVDQGGSSRRVQVDLEIHVPKQSSVEAATERGNVKIGGLAGAINVTAHRGSVEIRDAGKDVLVQMPGSDVRSYDLQISGVKGDFRATGRGDDVEITDVTGSATVEGEFHSIRIKNASKGGSFRSKRTDLTFGPLPGRLEMASGDFELFDANGGVSISTSNKNIRLENVSGRIKIDNRNGNVEVRCKNSPKEEIEVNNESGRIELSLPSDAAFEIAASSRGGDIETGFEGPELKREDDGNTTKLTGKVGKRGPQIRLHTTYGTLSVQKNP